MGRPEMERNTGGYIFPGKRAAGAGSFASSLGRAGVIGLHPVAGILVGGVLGRFLWKQFDVPWIFWILLFLGFVAGCMNAWRDMRVYLREQDGLEGNGTRGENNAGEPGTGPPERRSEDVAQNP